MQSRIGCKVQYPALLGTDMDWLGDDYPFSSNALSGKHAIVCGASKGIGAATAKMLAKAGANVTAVSRNPHDLVATLEGDGHTGITLDLEDQEASLLQVRQQSYPSCPLRQQHHEHGGCRSDVSLMFTDLREIQHDSRAHEAEHCRAAVMQVFQSQ